MTRIMKSLVKSKPYRFSALAISAKKMGKSIALNARQWRQPEHNHKGQSHWLR